jgi:hypothetical protein
MTSASSKTYSVFFVTRDRWWKRLTFHLALAVLCVLAFCRASYAQSTFGTVLGTVKDPSGSAVPRATVELLNVGTNATRTATTSDDGNYQFVNVEQGRYQLKVTSAGFQTVEVTAFDLSARETKRFDADMKVATQATSVTVEATSVLQTDTSSVAETKGSLELTDLPVAIGSRSNGSTSAFSTLTAQPGVQIDSNNNITVAGATTSQLSFSIDGISSVGPGATAGPLTEMFPSFNAIEEIRISENLNPAEYGGVADVTTVSKSGTNTFHGGAFENVQNNDFNAADTFSHTTPLIKMNDYGIYLGGPVILPKIYNGHDKTFFFGSFERLSLPKEETALLSTPTAAMRTGDLSAYLNTSPQIGGDGVALTGYPGNIIPASQINPWSLALLNTFYPLPNHGDPNAVVNNYIATYSIPIMSAQFDARVDEIISPKHLVFVRYTYKNRRVTDAPGVSPANLQVQIPGTPLVGETSFPEVDNALTAGYNWIISPSLVNEIRVGFTKSHTNATFGVTTQGVANALGLTGPPNGFPEALPSVQTTPEITLAGFMSIPYSPNNDLNASQGTVQISDSLTYTKGKHTIKLGGDFRHLTALFTNVFLNYRLGSYTFTGATLNAAGTAPWLGSGAVAPIAALLLGYPDATTVSTVLDPTTNSWANHYAFFIQDDFKVSSTFTLNYGLRYEYHPVFQDYNHNVANFDPTYTSVQNGQVVHGAVVIPGQSTYALVNPGFAAAVAPDPIITAAQAGIPVGLRFSQKTDFAPRIGFAWKLGNKMVLRGGYGRFIEAPLSLSAIDGWSVEASDVGGFQNSIGGNGLPIYKAPYSFPSNIAQPGTYWYDLATDIHYKDPYVQEWDLTIERDLGQGFGLRVGYDGSHGTNLPTDINLNQIPPNTLGYSTLASSAPYPQYAAISYQTNLGFSNYNSGTISIKKRAGNLQIEASYAFTRNLANTEGSPINASAQPNVNEFGNTLLTDPAHPGLDYGNVSFTRRQRFLTTFLYVLPFGKGRKFLSNSNRFTDALLGGWELSGIWLMQSGPFLTTQTNLDPSGTGYNLCPCNLGNGGRADTVPGVNPYAGQNLAQWINPAAFVDPGSNIGRFGDASQGDVVGPGTKVISASLIKRFQVTEQVRMEIGAQVANLTNHPNYQPPANLNVDVPAFGAITAMQSAEAGGPRQIQLTGRITF